METALFGTAAELKAQLDAGLDPKSKTPDGTTLLMMAAPDAKKVDCSSTMAPTCAPKPSRGTPL